MHIHQPICYNFSAICGALTLAQKALGCSRVRPHTETENVVAPLTFNDLAPENQELVDAALAASAKAYAPYSGFAVGAAVRVADADGNIKVVTGANVENAVYGLGICAEVSAIAAAHTLGVSRIEAIGVVGHRFFPPSSASQVVRPCGRCRQIILEASQNSSCPVTVFSCSGDLQTIFAEPISKLLPSPFGPADLGLDHMWPELRETLVTSVTRLRESKSRSGPKSLQDQKRHSAA